MNWSLPVDPHFIDSLGWTLIHSIWQIIAVSLLLWAGLRLTEKTKANLRYGISVAALLLCLALPAATFVRITGSEQIISAPARDLPRDYDDSGFNEVGTKPPSRADGQTRSINDEGAAWISAASVEGLGLFADRYLPIVFPFAVATWLL